MGAIATGGVRVLSQEVLRALRISPPAVEAVAAMEQRELERRERDYRLGTPFPDLTGKTVILVDDGVATGSSMLAAIQALRQLKPAAIVAAAPVMSDTAALALSREADRCEAVAVPEPFHAVGAWYRNFAQTSDEEVRALLRHGREAPAGAAQAEGRYAARR
jgi:predicted phosphoribosyltransferase